MADAAPIRIAAVTGATGFVGRHLVHALRQAGWHTRLLVRHAADAGGFGGPADGIACIQGDLADAGALRRLVDGADLVVHAAGAIRGRTAADFHAANVAGTDRLGASVALAAPRAHLVALSSLAARMPGLSAYAASKRAGEAALLGRAGSLAGLTILRPPAVYGPGDRASLTLFRAAAGRVLLLPAPAQARIALLHVHDLARRLVELAERGPAGGPGIVELADGQPGGYSMRTIMATAAAAVAAGRAQAMVQAPVALVRAAGMAADLFAAVAGRPQLFGAGKAAELLHPDWSVAAAADMQAIALDHGFAQTAAWYVAQGWLRAPDRARVPAATSERRSGERLAGGMTGRAT